MDIELREMVERLLRVANDYRELTDVLESQVNDLSDLLAKSVALNDLYEAKITNLEAKIEELEYELNERRDDD